MEIKARVSQKSITQEFIEILVTPKDAERIIDVISTVKKKAKLDRYEETIIDDLLIAFQRPEVKEDVEDLGGGIKKFTPIADMKAAEAEKSVDTMPVDIATVVNDIKKRLDPKGEKTMAAFIVESIAFGQKQFGITTVPKDGSTEAFYDWLLTNAIIRPDGSPNTDRR
jgi:hypothetical protein